MQWTNDNRKKNSERARARAMGKRVTETPIVFCYVYLKRFINYMRVCASVCASRCMQQLCILFYRSDLWRKEDK